MNRCVFVKPDDGRNCLLPHEHGGDHILCGVRFEEDLAKRVARYWGFSEQQAESAVKWAFSQPLKPGSDRFVEHLKFCADLRLVTLPAQVLHD